MSPLDPRNARASKTRGWIYIAWVFSFFMLGGLFAARRDRTSLSSSSPHSKVRSNWFSVSPKWLPFSRQGGDISVLDEHPIPRLMADAEQKFKALLAKQSKTLAQAVAEYKKRYGRDPPRGFDDWWEFATQNDVKLVDEYDAIFEDLGPFWLLSGREFRERAYEVRCPTLVIALTWTFVCRRVSCHPSI